MFTVSKRVVVIGGGVVGLCCAYYLERDGHEVAVLDRDQPESERCSSGNSGLVVPSHFVPLAAPGMVAYGLRQILNPKSPFRIKPQMSRELLSWMFKFWRSATQAHVNAAGPLLRDLSYLSRRLYSEIAQAEDFGFEQRGLLMICREDGTLGRERHEAERARALGIPADVLDAEGVSNIDPGVRYECAGGVYFPDDCQLDPKRFTSALRANLKDVRNGCEVSKVNVDSKGVQSVTTDSGTIEADAFVLAGGVWSAHLARGIGLHLPLQAGKGYSITLENPSSQPIIPSILVEGRVAITPFGSQMRVGGTMELAGIDDTIDRRRVDGIIETLCRYLPSFSAEEFKDQAVWKGLRPCSPDGIPYIGPFARYTNLYAATGHAMMGVSLGPATGYLIAQQIAGITPEVTSSLLSPDRF